MKKPFGQLFLKLFLITLAAAVTAPAADVERIIGHLNITNAPTVDGHTFDINGDTRVFTNDVTANPAIFVLTNSTIDGIQTTLFDHIADTPFAGNLYIYKVSTNSITFEAQEGAALALTIGGGWGYVEYSTNLTAFTNAFSVTIPVDQEDIETRTNIWSEVVYGVDRYSTNAFGTNATALSNFLNLGLDTQWLAPAKIIVGGILSNFVAHIVGGSMSNVIGHSITITNLDAPGAGVLSQRIGANSTAEGQWSVAYGLSSSADGFGSVAIGSATSADTPFGTALGSGARAGAFSGRAVAIGSASIADYTNSVAVGDSASASATNSQAFGAKSSATHEHSTAVGYGAATTQAAEVILGTDTNTVNIPGRLVSATQTNVTHTGRTTNSGSYSTPVTLISTLADGANSIVLDDEDLYIRFTGSLTTASTLDGITNGWDGRILYGENQEGFTITINHQSGLESNPRNRIVTPSGANIAMADGAWAIFVYDDILDRWKLAFLYDGTSGAGGGATYLAGLTDVDTNSVADGDVPTWNAASGVWTNAPPPGATGGEANTSSNVGSGVGIANAKSLVDLPFKSFADDPDNLLVWSTNANEITGDIDWATLTNGLAPVSYVQRATNANQFGASPTTTIKAQAQLTNIWAEPGTLSDPSIAARGDSATGLNFDGAEGMDFVTDGSRQMYLSSTAGVVVTNGNLRVVSTLVLPSLSSDRVLTLDGSGNVGVSATTPTELLALSGFTGTIANQAYVIAATNALDGALRGVITSSTNNNWTDLHSKILSSSNAVYTAAVGMTNDLNTVLRSYIDTEVAGATNVVWPLAMGGTGSALVDPNADRIGFWDDSAGTFTWLTPGSGLSITGTELTATAGDPTMSTNGVDVGSASRFNFVPGNLIDLSGTNAIGTNTLGIAVKGRWRTDLIPAGMFKAHSVTNPADIAEFEPGGTDGLTRDAWSFDGSTAQYVMASVPAFSDWDLSTVKVRVAWGQDFTNSNVGVTWSISAGAVGDGDPEGSNQGTAVEIDDDVQSGETVIDHATTDATTALTVGGTPQALDMIEWKVERDTADVDDDLEVDVEFYGLWVQWFETATPQAQW